MRRLLRWTIPATVLVAALPALAQASTPTLRATSRDGEISLRITGDPGSALLVGERGADAAPLPVTLTQRTATVPRVAVWSCTRRRRTFTVAAAAAPTVVLASTAVTTPSCATRLRASRLTRATVGRVARLRLTDGWQAGDVEARVCLRSPDAVRTCQPVSIPPGHRSATAKLRATSPGRWTLTVTAPGQRITRSLIVAPRGRLRVLATGDSMIQVVDGLLAADLGSAASVRSDAHISTGITKPFLLDWPALAARQARADRPDATVVFLGANDGFPIGGAACCGSAWIAAYAHAVEGMMRDYQRDGAGQVYWMLLPPPKPASFARVFRAVNAAIRRAAHVVGPGAHLIDVGSAVGPDVRQPDGVHLTVSGARVAAALIAGRLRQDGLA